MWVVAVPNLRLNMPQSKSNPRGTLVWFRRDLRLDDNAALYHALRSCRQLYRETQRETRAAGDESSRAR